MTSPSFFGILLSGALSDGSISYIRQDIYTTGIAVITDPDTRLGFKLSGVDVFHASSYEDAESYMKGFLRSREYGIVHTASLESTVRLRELVKVLFST